MLVKTIKGKLIDITTIISENENTIAVTGSGIRMNAKGDILGPGGQIIKKKEELDKEYAVKIDNSVKNARNISLGAPELNRYMAEQQAIKKSEMEREIREQIERKNHIRNVVNVSEFINPDDPDFDEKIKKQITKEIQNIKEEDISHPPLTFNQEPEDIIQPKKSKKKSPPPDEIIDDNDNHI